MREVLKDAEKIREDMIQELERLKREQRFGLMEQMDCEDEENEDFDFQGGYYLYRQRYETTIASTSWKLTQPLRKMMDFLHRQDNSVAEDTKRLKHEKKRIPYEANNKHGIAVVCLELQEELLPEILKRLKYIEEPLDIYLPEKINLYQHETGVNFKCLNTIKKETFMAYELVLCIKTRKSTLKQDLDGVLRSAEMVKQAILLLRGGMPRGGLLSGDLPTGSSGEELFERNEQGSLFYPWNNCFWIKTNAVDELIGDIAKLLGSRKFLQILPEQIRKNGYVHYLYNVEENRFFQEKSRCFIKKYLENQEKQKREEHERYLVDVMDTVFTTLFYDENGFYQYLERIFEERYHLDWRFSKIRLEADKQIKDGSSLKDIYLYIQTATGCEDTILKNMYQEEIQQWNRVLIPRSEVISFCKECQKKKHAVFFVNNSCLENHNIKQLLQQQGIIADRIITKKEIIFEREQNSLYLTSRYYSEKAFGKTIMLLSPQMQFYLSEQYDKFEKYLSGNMENNLMLGILVNKYLYNSPMALRTDGSVECSGVRAVAEGVVGPIFLAFMEYLEDTTSNDERLLFLAREGWFLQRLYAQYCKAFQKDERKNSYFYTSRRAASIPQISSYQDIEELLKSPYNGKLSTLMRERFGLEYKKKDCWIESLKKERIVVLEALLEQFDDLKERIEYEKQIYLKYIAQEGYEKEDLTVVDVGYSGSIQYYLMKLLQKRLDGCYLATEKNVKPERLNGVSKGMYHFWSSPVFSKMTLFIEAVTCAPHGQVVCFEESNGQIIPVLKEKENKAFVKAKPIQESILEYVNLMGSLLAEIPHKFSHNLVLDLFTEIQRQNFLGSDLKQIFAVNDEYCNDGEWYFDESLGEWKLRQGS